MKIEFRSAMIEGHRNRKKWDYENADRIAIDVHSDVIRTAGSNAGRDSDAGTW